MPRVRANLGAEEADPVHASVRARLEPLERLFQDVCAREAPVFDWLPRGDALVAWYNSDAAEREARELEVPLFGAAPAIVRRCHDKAFAQRVATSSGLQPPLLIGHVAVYDADALEPGPALERTLTELRAQLEACPGSHGLTLKPRLGTSGRGRVALRETSELDAVRAAMPRLRRAGGFVAEPWLARVRDLSASLYVDPSGAVTLVGTAELLVTPSGVYRGHRGWVDARGRMSSPSTFDEELREAAVGVALAAAAQGYHGACGVDAFVFEHEGRERLRGVVEFNARFTVGFLVAACLRARLRDMVSSAGLRPDHSLAFRFDLPETRYRREPTAAPITELALRAGGDARSGGQDDGDPGGASATHAGAGEAAPRMRSMRAPRLCVADALEWLPVEPHDESELDRSGARDA